MCRKKIIAALLSIIIFSSCFNKGSQENISRTVYFEYGKYEDSVYAILHGIVYEEPANNAPLDLDSLLPLPGVQIFIESETPGFIKSYNTDAHGEFTIPFQKGVYNFSLKRTGYQPLKVTNYIADPDHSAHTKIILVKE